MGLVCKYWTVFLEFPKKMVQKHFLAGFVAEKIGPRGGWAWEPSAHSAHGRARGTQIRGFPWKIMDFDAKIMDFEQNCHAGVIYMGNMG